MKINKETKKIYIYYVTFTDEIFLMMSFFKLNVDRKKIETIFFVKLNKILAQSSYDTTYYT